MLWWVVIVGVCLLPRLGALRGGRLLPCGEAPVPQPQAELAEHHVARQLPRPPQPPLPRLHLQRMLLPQLHGALERRPPYSLALLELLPPLLR